MIPSFIGETAEALLRQGQRFPASETPKIDIAGLRHTVGLFRSIIFAGHFRLNGGRSEDHVSSAAQGLLSEADMLSQLYEDIMAQLALVLENGCADKVAEAFVRNIPQLRRVLETDVQAVFDGDPAAKSHEEVILCYPSITAVLHYRLAHELLSLEVPLLPRAITELAHSETGIDIHPGAVIGEYFSIDHGTGVVIGETAVVGNHVRLYQGVTLGAKSFRYDEDGNMINEPRHPVLEDNVIVYSNSSILGRITIGHDSVIGGNVWQTASLPPYSKVSQGKSVITHFENGGGI